MSLPFHPLRLFLFVTLLLATGSMLHAQIEVAPTRVLVNFRSRSTEVTVYNPTTDPVEVNTDLGFKLFKSDSLGNVTMVPGGTPDELRRSCRDWIKIYPHRFTLPPGTSRSVRILIVPSDSLTDGEYWGRAVFGCTPLKSDLPEPGDSSIAIRTNLTMRVEFDIPVIFRVGTATTGINFDTLTVRKIGAETRALLDVTRSGNSAYRGTLTTLLRAADGSQVANTETQYTVEFALRKGIALPSLALGSYTLEVESRSIKKGSANDAVIQAPSMRKVYMLTVTGSGIETTVKE
jgi:P pilus assembly chaperone PapD